MKLNIVKFGGIMESPKLLPENILKGGVNSIKKCGGKDTLQRINYLYQASNALVTKNIPSNIAATMYSNLLVAISRKAVQRMDVDIKRSICKGCRSLLLAGITCKIRIKKKRSIWKCLTCNSVKIFDLKNPDYRTWTQTDESVVGILDYKN